jgi:hypothetical protein
MNIINKILEENKKSCDNKIKFSMWADHTTTKTSTGKTPFKLVYKLNACLPMNLQILSLQLSQHLSTNKEVLQGRIDQLMKLE